MSPKEKTKEKAAIAAAETRAKSEQAPLKIIPLGGLEEVGRNMTLLEYDKNILVIDVGFGFPEEDMPGIDYVIPNVEYLKNKKDWIRGVIITHAHYDHIGSIPYIIDKIGYPPVFAPPLSKAIILKRQDDFRHLRKLKVETISKESPETINLGPFRIDPFHVNHNIPDSIGLAIQTPVGQIMHTCDFKIDFQPVADKPADLAKIVQLASRGTTLLLSDSTGAERPGHTPSEQIIMKNLEDILENTKGRVIVATFASLLERVQQVVWIAERLDRKVAVDGYSMRTNVAIAQQLGYLKTKKHTLITPEESLKLPDERVVVLCTGAQGEDRAVLMRIANKEHKYLKIRTGDTVIFSSSIIPGNERAIQALKDSIYRQGGAVFDYIMMDIHASGHAHQEDLKLMINLIKPKFFMPIQGFHSMLRANAKLAESLGILKENIVIASNGSVVELTPDKIRLAPQRVPANYVMVDGLGIGDIGEVVLRDRQMMSQDGMVVIIAVIDREKSMLRSDPDVISRGFVYMRESKELVNEIKKKSSHIVGRMISGRRDIDETYVKNNLRDELGEFIFQKTKRRPMILPVLISV